MDKIDSQSNLLEFPTSIEKEINKVNSNDNVPTPVSDKIALQASSLDKLSKYPSSFDYDTYTRLEQRFGLEQPRGGIAFKTTFKLVNHYSGCTRCHYAFELDSYGRGCTHDCVFCYAKDQLTQRAFWNRPFPMPIDLAEIRKTFYTVFETSKSHKFRSVLEKRIPLRLGSMSDPFMWMDRKYGVTAELLKILNFYKYPYVAFTRSDLVARDEYLNLIDPRLASVQFSISGENSKLTRLLEPGAPSVKRRFEALKILSQAGVVTAVRINPLFPKYPDGYFTNPELVKKTFGNNIPEFPLLDIDHPEVFFQMIKESGTRTVIPGFVRLTHREIKRMETALDMPFKSFFTYGAEKGALNLYYSDKEIAHYYKILSEEAKKNNVRFTTCYIGNGIKDYFQYQDLWTNKKDCCDIVGAVPAFKTTSTSVPWEERIKHATSKPIAIQSMNVDKGMEELFTNPSTKKEVHSKIIPHSENPQEDTFL